MANEITPYIPRNPGDLLSAGDWNEMQVEIKKDISDQITKAVGEITSVPHADNADKLEGKSLEEITKQIVQQVLEEIRAKSGNYQRIFKRLVLHQEAIINHGMKACPLVDVYQLDYFLAVVATGEEDAAERAAWINFYLYHERTDRRIRIPNSKPPVTVDTEVTGSQASRIRWEDMLALYGVEYTDETDLEELEVNFWNAFFKSPPNDDFQPDQYGHSPWFEKCCGEMRTVHDLKSRLDWDKIYLKWLPRKTVNLIRGVKGAGDATGDANITPAPTQIQVIQYDLDTIGVKLIEVPVYPDAQLNPPTTTPEIPPLPQEFRDELKVMLLLKV